MMVYVLCRWDAEGECCFNETARISREEAEAFIAQQDTPSEWSIDPVDCPLIETGEPQLETNHAQA